MKNKLWASTAALAMIFALQSSAAQAAPAPALTNLQIVGVSTDTLQPNWINVSYAQQSVSTALTGTYGFTANYVEGTPMLQANFYALRTYNNGVDITDNTWEAHADDYLVDSANMVYGTIRYRGFELAGVSSGSFTIKAQNYYAPNNAFFDTLNLTISPTLAKTNSIIELRPTLSSATLDSLQKSVISELEKKYHTKLFVTHQVPRS